MLPEKPNNWGATWYDQIGKECTALHKELVYALGNHIILEDSKNSHVRNLSFEDKVCEGGGAKHDCPDGKQHNHYSGSDFNSVEFAIKEYDNVGVWGMESIERNAMNIMNTIIDFFPATKEEDKEIED